MATTGKIAEVFFENMIETYEHQDKMIDLVTSEEAEPAMMQNANNIYWKPIQQHAPIIEGFSLTGQETDIIEETVPLTLGTPTNDFVQQRADDLRDMRFWERRGKQSGMRQATELNKRIASAIALQGSIFYRSNATSGYDFIAAGQAAQNERQLSTIGEGSRCYLLNDRDTLKFASDLAGRQTLQGRPEMTWQKGQIGQNVAEYDVYTASFLPNLAGGANPATTVTGDQSFAPEGGSVSATGVVTNVDYRVATIAVAASASYNVGDKVSFSNSGVTVKALALADKTDTNQAMTFTIVGKPSGTSIQVYPKPIALDDPGLTTIEAAYANIDTQILDTATVDRLNTDTSAKTNIFFDKGAIEITNGTIPADLYAQYDGNKVLTETLSNGQEIYMMYDGNIETLTFRYRLFMWYGINVVQPQNCGVGITFS